jgi:hypothetical protein
MDATSDDTTPPALRSAAAIRWSDITVVSGMIKDSQKVGMN